MIGIFISALFGGLMLGLYIGAVFLYPIDKHTYQKCRYYDQTIERCVTELGWEKK